MLGGRLDRRITIESASTAQDALGHPAETWSTFATVWAEKRDISVRDRFAAEQHVEEEVTTFVIRWLAGVTVEMRVVHDSKTYEIVGLAEIGRQEGIEISAKALLP